MAKRNWWAFKVKFGTETNTAAQAVPGAANTAFDVREFKATNGQTLRYILFVPKEKAESLPFVLCLHGAGGGTDAANLLASNAMQAKHPCH